MPYNVVCPGESVMRTREECILMLLDGLFYKYQLYKLIHRVIQLLTDFLPARFLSY